MTWLMAVFIVLWILLATPAIIWIITVVRGKRMAQWTVHRLSIDTYAVEKNGVPEALLGSEEEAKQHIKEAIKEGKK